MRRLFPFVVLGWSLATRVLAQEAGADLLKIIPSGTEVAAPVPLRPAPAARPNSSRRPEFELKSGDRVVWLGDRLVASEAANGFIETRMTSRFPDRKISFRHLDWLTNNPLVQADVKAGDDWLTNLLTEVATAKPNVVIVGYGSVLAEAGTNGLPAFRTNYARLLDGLRAINTNEPVRLVLLTPLSRSSSTNKEELAKVNLPLQLATDAILGLGTNRNAEVANFLLWSTGENDYLRGEEARLKVPFPPLLDSGMDPSPYGWSRLNYSIERALRWAANNWRMGYGESGTFRRGGFGLSITNESRSDSEARWRATEDQLPSPNAAGFIETSRTKPQCYLQVPGLKPGLYELRVDKQPVLTGNHAEWARYEIITQGPSWDQAEQLRQAIVKKNQAVRERWNPQGAGRRAAKPGALTGDEPAVQELEEKVHSLKRPVPRLYEIVRVGDAPADTKAGQ